MLPDRYCCNTQLEESCKIFTARLIFFFLTARIITATKIHKYFLVWLHLSNFLYAYMT